VNVPEVELTELRGRIKATKWPERETVTDASQGMLLATIQELAHYWVTDYDWRKCEAKRKLGNKPHPDQARRVRSSPFPGQSIQLADVRTFRLSRYRGNHRPPGPGSNNSYSNILADGSSHEGLGGNSEQGTTTGGQSNRCQNMEVNE
jgi:hypothetical protein